MKSPNHNEAGMLAFALASATLALLVEKHILTPRDELSILKAARDSFDGVHTINAKVCANLMAEAVKAHPETE